jgi:hypothetical protein
MIRAPHLGQCVTCDGTVRLHALVLPEHRSIEQRSAAAGVRAGASRCWPVFESARETGLFELIQGRLRNLR